MINDETRTEQKASQEEQVWAVGEHPDTASSDTIGLAHKALQRFPDLVKRHKRFAGSVAVVSTALLMLASIAVARRLRKGESIEKILQELTSEEIEGAVRLRKNGEKGKD